MAGDKKNTGLIKQIIDIPLEELASVDVSEKRLEKLAKGYFVGKTAVGRRSDVRKILEEKVTDKIGKKGKLLTDKLFELIEGVYMVDKTKEVQGKREVRYYKTPPNLNAIIYALDRVLGKPKQLSVQANFSLSSLLKLEEGNEHRQDNNKEVPEVPPVLH